MSFSAPETNFGRRQPMSEKKLNSQLIIGGLQTIAVEAYLAGELPLLTAMQFSVVIRMHTFTSNKRSN